MKFLKGRVQKRNLKMGKNAIFWRKGLKKTWKCVFLEKQPFLENKNSEMGKNTFFQKNASKKEVFREKWVK